MRRGKLEAELTLRLSELIKRLDVADTPEERSKVIEEIKEVNDVYHEVKNDNKTKLADIISLDTIIKSGVSLATIWLILNFEKEDILTTKALGVFMRMMP